MYFKVTINKFKSSARQSIGGHVIHELNIDGLGALAIGNPEHPALICLHGWGGSRHIWRRFMSAYGCERYIVSLDLPGSGKTPALKEWTPEALKNWLLDAADRLSIDRFSIMAHSLGGNIALHASILAPERVNALVLASPAISSDELASARIYCLPFSGPFFVGAARLLSGAFGFLSPLLPEKRGRKSELRSWFRRSIYFYRDNSTLELYRQIMGMCRFPIDYSQIADSIPLLIIHGSLDSVAPIEHSRAFIDALQKKRATSGRVAELIVYQDIRHTPMDSVLARFTEDSRNFLSAQALSQSDSFALMEEIA